MKSGEWLTPVCRYDVVRKCLFFLWVVVNVLNKAIFDIWFESRNIKHLCDTRLFKTCFAIHYINSNHIQLYKYLHAIGSTSVMIWLFKTLQSCVKLDKTCDWYGVENSITIMSAVGLVGLCWVFSRYFMRNVSWYLVSDNA